MSLFIVFIGSRMESPYGFLLRVFTIIKMTNLDDF